MYKWVASSAKGQRDERREEKGRGGAVCVCVCVCGVGGGGWGCLDGISILSKERRNKPNCFIPSSSIVSHLALTAVLFTTALVGSLAMAGAGVYSMLVAKVYNRIGPFKTAIMGTVICMGALLVTSRGTSIYFIMISYGFVFGIGSCFVFLPLYLAMPRYFIKRCSLALGLVATGPGGGLFVMSPVLQALVDALDWRGTFMAMAGIVAIIGLLICVFLRMPDSTDQLSTQNEEKEKLCDFSVYRNKRFVIFTVAMCLMYIGHYIPSVHMVSRLKTRLD